MVLITLATAYMICNKNQGPFLSKIVCTQAYEGLFIEKIVSVIFLIDAPITGAQLNEIKGRIDFNVDPSLLDKEKIKSVLNFLEKLEDDEDVQHVYANLEIDNNFGEKTLT